MRLSKIILILTLILGIFFSVKKFISSEKTILRIGSECDYIPNSWEESKPSDSNLPVSNHDGFYAEGYDIQMAKLVAEEMGMEPQIVKLKWENLIPALRRREIDIIFSSMLDTEERRKKIDFSNPYELKKTEYTVMVNKNGKYADITKLEELYHAKILSQKGTYFETAIDQIPGAVKVPPLENIQAMVDELNKNAVDGIIIDWDTGQVYERNNKDLKIIRFPEGEGFIIGFSGVCAGVRKNNRDLLDKVNGAIDSISYRQKQKVMDQVISKIWKNL